MKKYTWHKIADSIGELSFSPNGLAEISVEGKNICLVQHKDELYACAVKCPHAGGAMPEGHIDALGNITCPLHRYKFSLSKGHNVSGEGYYLKTYPVEQRPSGIFIGMEDVNLMSRLK